MAIALPSTALGIQNRGEEIHLSEGSKCHAVALPKSKGTETRTQPGCGVRSQKASQRAQRKEELAGREVILNIPKYAGFHNSTVLRQYFGGD